MNQRDARQSQLFIGLSAGGSDSSLGAGKQTGRLFLGPQLCLLAAQSVSQRAAGECSQAALHSPSGWPHSPTRAQWGRTESQSVEHPDFLISRAPLWGAPTGPSLSVCGCAWDSGPLVATGGSWTQSISFHASASRRNRIFPSDFVRQTLPIGQPGG